MGWDKSWWLKIPLVREGDWPTCYSMKSVTILIELFPRSTVKRRTWRMHGRCALSAITTGHAFAGYAWSVESFGACLVHSWTVRGKSWNWKCLRVARFHGRNIWSVFQRHKPESSICLDLSITGNPDITK